MLALGFNDASGNVLRSLDWVPMGTINRYQKLLFPAYGLKQIAAFPPLRGLVNFSFAPFRPSLSRLMPARHGSIREVSEFTAAFDDLWARASAKMTCAISRNAAFLHWQFHKQPGKEFYTLGLFHVERLLGCVGPTRCVTNCSTGSPTRK